jgi:4-hydroxy-tetrahydrodipicolinate reductase
MRIVINGASGRMGRELVASAMSGYHGATLVAAVDVVCPSVNGPAYTALADVTEDCDVLIDFSHHSATKSVLDFALLRGIPVVIATTGQTDEEMAYIAKAAESIPVFKSANMSVGVALVAKLVKEVAAKFGACDIEIVETHHNRKVDAPSGTAIMLADAVREARPELHYNLGRSGMAKREPDEIGISAVRMGNIVGTHEVMFGTDTQTITVTHQAHDRALFADGAVAAARFLAGQPAGLYNMDDLLAD